MGKFDWREITIGGKTVFQVTIDGHPHGNPCLSEEDANATVERLEQGELQREIDRESESESDFEP